MAVTLPILNARVVRRLPTSSRVQVLVNDEPLPPMWVVEIEHVGTLAICDTEAEAQAVLAALDLDKLLERVGRRLTMKAV